jgi:hypothetical protein
MMKGGIIISYIIKKQIIIMENTIIWDENDRINMYSKILAESLKVEEAAGIDPDVPNLEDIYKAEDDSLEEKLAAMKAQVKAIEQRIRENKKPKTITISNQAHSKVKQHCMAIGQNIGDWAEKILLKEIEDSRCIIVENDWDDKKAVERLSETFREYVSGKVWFKTDKILMSGKLRMVGKSRIDGWVVYEVDSDDPAIMDALKERGLEMKLTDSKSDIVEKDFDFDGLEVVII